MREAETKLCTRCGNDICDTCKFDNINLTNLCSKCEANICDACLKGERNYD